MFTGLEDPALWVAIAFVGFVALLLYYGVPDKMASALDGHADKIRNDLDEAKRLREEAQALLNDFKRKQQEAQAEAEEIITLAKREAENLATETSRKLTEQLERRAKQAEDKIARAEAQAMNEVRARASELSIKAAEIVIRERLAGNQGEALINDTIADLARHLTRH
jgi:F-type H+-transporting ATPase subunit b